MNMTCTEVSRASSLSVIARSTCDEAIQSVLVAPDCFVASLLAMTNSHGFKIAAPVVARASKSVCALAASFSA